MISRVTRQYVVVAGAMASLLPQVAFAQRAPEPHIDLNLDFITKYDENVSRVSDEVAHTRNVSRSDVSISPMITVDVERPLGSQNRVGVTGHVGYQFYRRNTQLNRERISLNADSDFKVGPCWISPRANFSRFQTDLGDFLILDQNQIVNVKNAETIIGYGAELSCGRGYGFRPVIGYDHRRGRNTADWLKRADYDQDSYSAGVRYIGPSFGELNVFVRRTDTDRPNMFLLPGQSFIDGYKGTDYGVSYARNIGSRYQVNGSLAWSEINSKNPLVGDHSGLTWNVSGTARIGSRAVLKLTTADEFRNALTSDASVSRRRSYSANLDYAVSERLKAYASVQFDKTKYDYGYVPGLYTIENERRRYYDLGAKYDIGRRAYIGVGVGREERRANNRLWNYSSNNARMSVGMKF